jgi:hypothetical protein
MYEFHIFLHVGEELTLPQMFYHKSDFKNRISVSLSPCLYQICLYQKCLYQIHKWISKQLEISSYRKRASSPSASAVKENRVRDFQDQREINEKRRKTAETESVNRRAICG